MSGVLFRSEAENVANQTFQALYILTKSILMVQSNESDVCSVEKVALIKKCLICGVGMKEGNRLAATQFMHLGRGLLHFNILFNAVQFSGVYILHIWILFPGSLIEVVDPIFVSV